MGGAYSLFDVGGAIGAVGLVATFLHSAIRNTRQLYREEPLSAFAEAKADQSRGESNASH
jgi:hypothetical protein